MDLLTKRRVGKKIMWDPATVATGVPGHPVKTRPISPALLNTFWYPNRPTLMPADVTNVYNPSRAYIDSLESSGLYVAELKWNGDNTLIYTDSGRWFNRHNSLLKYSPSSEVLAEIAHIFPPGCIVNAETVNRCTKNIKNKIVVHCLLAYKGQLLMGKTWGDSRKILEDLSGKFGEHVVLSEIHTTGFWDLFKYAWDQDASIEGIILKNPRGRLVYSAKPLADVSWQLKIRKPCKKYAA